MMWAVWVAAALLPQDDAEHPIEWLSAPEPILDAKVIFDAGMGEITAAWEARIADLDPNPEALRQSCEEAVRRAREQLIEELEEAVVRRRRGKDLGSVQLVQAIRGLKDGGEPPGMPLSTKPPRGFGTVELRGHHYKLLTEGKPWFDARERCRELGGYLVCIETAEELEILREELLADWPRVDSTTRLVTSRLVWVGASDLESEGDWRWLSGVVVPRGLWHGGQPLDNRGAEHHAGLVWHRRSHGDERLAMIDWPGDFQAHFICEWGPPDRRPPWDVLEGREEKAVAEYWARVAGAQRDLAGQLEMCAKRLRPARRKLEREAAGIEGKLAKALEEASLDALDQNRVHLAGKLSRLCSEVEEGLWTPGLRPPGSPPVPSYARSWGGHRYALVPECRTWRDARLICEDEGGHLVILDRVSEMQALDLLLSSTGRQAAWIGASGARPTWIWCDGEPYSLDVEIQPGPEDEEWGEGHGLRLRLAGDRDPVIDSVGRQQRLPFLCEWDY